MDRGQNVIPFTGGRMRPRLLLNDELPVEAGVFVEPGRCTHPDIDGEKPLEELCQALARGRGDDVALQLRWPDGSPAAFVPSVREAASLFG